MATSAPLISTSNPAGSSLQSNRPILRPALPTSLEDKVPRVVPKVRASNASSSDGLLYLGVGRKTLWSSEYRGDCCCMYNQNRYILERFADVNKFRFLLLSPWQWFVSTRSFSNSLETALTAMALYYWPWDWMKTTATPSARKQDAKK